MGRAEDIILEVCEMEDIVNGEEWVKVPINLHTFLKVIITLDRESKKNNPVAVETEVLALVNENSTADDIVIYKDGSVIHHVRSAWAFTARRGSRIVQEDSGAFPVTTSSMTMEIMAVTRALAWMELQNATHVCILSDSMSMLSKVRTGYVRRQCLQSVLRSCLRGVTFIFVPGHAGVKGNERADKLASMAAFAEGKAMDRADILNAVREKLQLEDSGAVRAIRLWPECTNLEY